jgi:hypothetical protein
VRGDLLRVFERSAVFKIYANARRPEHVRAYPAIDLRFKRPPAMN